MVLVGIAMLIFSSLITAYTFFNYYGFFAGLGVFFIQILLTGFGGALAKSWSK